MPEEVSVTCPACGGTGLSSSVELCANCSGAGQVAEGSVAATASPTPSTEAAPQEAGQVVAPEATVAQDPLADAPESGAELNPSSEGEQSNEPDTTASSATDDSSAPAPSPDPSASVPAADSGTVEDSPAVN